VGAEVPEVVGCGFLSEAGAKGGMSSKSSRLIAVAVVFAVDFVVAAFGTGSEIGAGL
jgi:hypothetical protein